MAAWAVPGKLTMYTLSHFYHARHACFVPILCLQFQQFNSKFDVASSNITSIILSLSLSLSLSPCNSKILPSL